MEFDEKTVNDILEKWLESEVIHKCADECVYFSSEIAEFLRWCKANGHIS